MTRDRAKDELVVKNWVETLYACFRNNDLDKLISLLSDDIIIMPPNMHSLHGLNDNLKLLQPWFEQNIMTNEVGEIEVRIDSNLAYARVEYKDSYYPKEGGDIHKLDNKALWILERQPDGEWKAIRGMYNRKSIPE